jgi:hypothetical protein
MTSALQPERLDFLLDQLANNKPLPLDLDQKIEEPPLGLDQKNDRSSGKRWLSSKRWIKRPSLGKRSSRVLIPYLIASSYLIPFCIGVAITLAWQSYGTPSTDQELAAVRQSVDQLSAMVQQMAGDIATQQAILRKVSAPPPSAPRRAN